MAKLKVIRNFHGKGNDIQKVRGLAGFTELNQISLRMRGMCGRWEGMFSVRRSACSATSIRKFSLACDMKGRDPLYASRCFEKCITMNSRQGTLVM
ncbi:hypothetical protein K1T71_003201, partial [Dendrolimus kikuchii]